jgi:hypothetical protein
MKIIDCQTTKSGIFAIMTDQEKIDLLIKVAHWIESNTKAERKYHTNYGIIEDITNHGSGYSSAICEALGVDPDAYEWRAE